MEIAFDPIGYVRNGFPRGRKPPTWLGISSKIEIDPRWIEALEGLDEFSHIIVLCYLHWMQGKEPVLQIHPQGSPEMPQVGLLSTRTPQRPNPISFTAVPLIAREGTILHVRNLDMYDGTPVLDVKPYLTRGDCHPEATGPDWIYHLWATHDRLRSDRDQQGARL